MKVKLRIIGAAAPAANLLKEFNIPVYKETNDIKNKYGNVMRDNSTNKFNFVGSEDLDNLELAQIIADAQGKELKYEMVDFHSSRPGHDLRYALDGTKMKELGWEPAKSARERIAEVTQWTLENERWITL